jgi:hypothetical protein
MAKPRTSSTPNAYPYPGISIWRRLKEIDMFFNRRDKVHQTMRRLARRLEKARIPYAIMGGMAVNAHGARRTTDDVNVLLTPACLKQFHESFVGTVYEPVPGRSRRFMEKQSGVGVDVLITGGYPGNGKPGPIQFPDPSTVRVEIENAHFVKLAELIQLKLAARRHYDFGDVVFLIRTHNLDESFADQLHPAVRQDYIECLEEKRREDEYQARIDADEGKDN